MSTISLREYISKLDPLLASNATDEVIHHCRHILQYFPKNVAVYRSLGRALVYSARWDEADTVFRRVLGVYPDDVLAHIGLSEVYQNKKQMDEAIWHLERAFEQDPNDADVINSLRDLYRRFRQVEQTKLQLTAAAVARQYVRSGLYQQAIDTLRSSLERTPDRMDLRLLLAQTLWGSDHHVEAAEVALDVLDTLPDCLEANRIMTLLWLEEQRPSDAQHYLNKIEAVDPYVALELAEGKPPAPDAFRLEELDYRHAAQKEMATSRPSWLQEIGNDVTSPTQQEDWASFLGDSAQKKGVTGPMPTPIPASMDALDSDLPDDWMLGITGSPAQTPAAEVPPAISTGFTDFLNSLDKSAPPAGEASASPADIDQSKPDEMPAFLLDLDESAPAASHVSTGFTDYLAAEEAMPAQTEAGADEELFGADEMPDWLRSSMPDESAPEVVGSPADLDNPADMGSPASAPTSPDEDPLAWLRDSGVNIDDSASRDVLPGLAEDTADEMKYQDPAANPLSWMQRYDDEIVFETGELTDSSQSAPATSDTPAANAEADADDPMAWLRGAGVEVSDETPAQAADAIPSTDSVASELAQQSDVHDWFGEQTTDEKPDTGGLEWLSEPHPVEPSPADVPAAQSTMPSADEELDWMRQFEDEFNAESPAPMSEMNAASQDSPADDDLSWMSHLDDAATDKPQEQPAKTSFTGFLNEMDTPQSESAASSASDDPMAWMRQFDSSPAEAGQESSVSDEPLMADMPDWLADVKPIEAPRTEGRVTDLLNRMGTALPEEIPAEDGEDQVTNWMSSLGTPPTASEPETPSAGGEHSWMNEMDRSSSEPEKSGADDEFSWMNDLEQPSSEPTPEASAPEEMNWMKELGGNPADADVHEQPASTGDSELGWLNELEPSASTPEPETSGSEAAGSGEEFNWMSELGQPASTPEPETSGAEASTPDDDLGWMNDLGQPTASTEPAAAQPSDADAEPKSEDAEFDWMRSMDEAHGETEPETSAADAGWVNSEDEEKPVAETPDWLSELQPSSPPPPPKPATGGFTDFLKTIDTARKTGETPAVQSSASQEQPSQENVPDWLAAVSGAASSDDEPQTPAAQTEDSGYDWKDDEEEDDDAVSGEVPDWLSGIVKSQPEEEEQSQAAEPVESAGSEFDWLNAINEPSSESEAENKPEAVEEHADEPVTAAPAANNQWFEFDEDKELASAPQDEEEVTMSSIPAATNAPDWLNAMVPGLDVDFEAGEDEQVEQEFASGAAYRSRERGENRRAPEFDWVSKLVDEELSPASQPSRPPRFSFSRVPAWLRSRAKETARPAAEMVKPPQTMAEVQDKALDDDFDDWLKVDDDLDSGLLDTSSSADKPKADKFTSDDEFNSDDEFGLDDEAKTDDDDFDLPDWLK